MIEEDYNLMAPNGFTPNGDGINDYFMPEALKLLGKKFTMQVISKKGQVVFETKNVESPWNGKLDNTGSILENGPYAWTVKLEDGSVYSGTVILISD
jgi:gliding motility-associated-like protein